MSVRQTPPFPNYSLNEVNTRTNKLAAVDIVFAGRVGGGHRSGPGEHPEWQAAMTGLDALRPLPGGKEWGPPAALPAAVAALKHLRERWLSGAGTGCEKGRVHENYAVGCSSLKPGLEPLAGFFPGCVSRLRRYECSHSAPELSAGSALCPCSRCFSRLSPVVSVSLSFPPLVTTLALFAPPRTYASRTHTPRAVTRRRDYICLASAHVRESRFQRDKVPSRLFLFLRFPYHAKTLGPGLHHD